MKRVIKSSTTVKEYDSDSLSQIKSDMLDIISRLTAQAANASTYEQEQAISNAKINIRKAYNAIN